MFSRLTLFLAGFGPAAIYGFTWRAWQIVAAPLTLFLISRHMSPATQGYYYTFGSVVALQSFFELGLFLIIVNVAAHEWSDLRIDEHGRIAGGEVARGRLISLGRLVFKYYLVAASGFFLCLLFGGTLFFSRASDVAVEWQKPWTALAIAAALNLLLEPFCYFLEGCSQVKQVSLFRLTQSMLAALAGWLVLLNGGGLWMSFAIAVTSCVSLLAFLLGVYGRFFASLLHPPKVACFSWRADIWPLQWRVACSGVVNYFGFSLFSPVVFKAFGPVAAGQVGMTMQIVGGIQGLALTVLKVRTPEFGMLAARKQFTELDKIWRRSAGAALVLFLCGGLGIAFVVVFAASRDWAVALRVLPPHGFLAFVIGGACLNFSQSLSTYLRAHKQEPILAMSVTQSVLIGIMVLSLGSILGPSGIGWAYAMIVAGCLWWQSRIWRRCRIQWHHGGVIPAS